MMENEEFLIAMLEDESEENASLAMRELLTLDEPEAIISRFQDAPSALLRRRIHQMACILSHRFKLDLFTRMVKKNDLTHWECLAWLNEIVEFRTSIEQIDGMLAQIMSDAFNVHEEGEQAGIRNAEEFRLFIQHFGIAVDESDDNFITKFLLADVLIHNSGDPVTVGVILQRAGEYCGWMTRLGYLVKHNSAGRSLCLLDFKGNAILIAPDWPLVKMAQFDFQPLFVHDMALCMLGKLYSSACIDQITSVMLDLKTLLQEMLQ